MKVLIVSPISIFPNTRGSTNRILELAKGLKKAGANVFILHAGYSGIIKDGISFSGYPSFSNLLGPKNIIGRFLDQNIGLFRRRNDPSTDLSFYPFKPTSLSFKKVKICKI